MISKYLEKRIELIPDENEKNSFYPFNLEYYLIVDDNPVIDDIDVDKVYGIEIVKKINEENIEVGRITNLSCCREKTREILLKLAYNTVTPVSLLFVLDDIIGT